MTVKLDYYGMIRELAGKASEELSIAPEFTVSQLKSVVGDKYPGILNMTYQVAVDNVMVREEDATINSGARISLLPPFAGG